MGCGGQRGYSLHPCAPLCTSRTPGCGADLGSSQSTEPEGLWDERETEIAGQSGSPKASQESACLMAARHSPFDGMSFCFENYNENHPHKELKMLSRRGFKELTAKRDRCPI